MLFFWVFISYNKSFRKYFHKITDVLSGTIHVQVNRIDNCIIKLN